MTEWLGVVPSIASALAAGLSVVATWRSPIVAARLAETMRRNAEQDHQTRERKLQIFASLMQERADLNSASGARTLNQIDIAFAESPAVKEAWSKLFSASQRRSVFPPLVPDEALADLLSEIARDIGLSGRVLSSDIARVYFPDAVRKAHMREDLEREQALRDLLNELATGQTRPPEAGSAWPPPP